MIPADRKWFARICVAAVLAHTLIEIDPQYPEVSADTRQELPRPSANSRHRRPGRRADPYAARSCPTPSGGRNDHNPTRPVQPTRPRPRPGTPAAPAGSPTTSASIRPPGCPPRGPRNCCARTARTRCRRRNPRPGWLRFLDEYRSYMQIILVAAAVVSLLIKEWSTAVLLVLLTVVNAVVGLRQEGKAESAMNALKSMMKATARVRRDGLEAEIPAEQVVVGDIVLHRRRGPGAGGRPDHRGELAADRRVGADRRERARGQGGRDAVRRRLARATRPNMAFMNTPVTHGSGTMVVTGTGAEHRAGQDLRDAVGHGEGRSRR